MSTEMTSAAGQASEPQESTRGVPIYRPLADIRDTGQGVVLTLEMPGVGREDVETRGLSEKILLVCCGEMGHTPRINDRGGRDHWGALAPLLLAGGGLNMGQVIGQSTRDAAEPLSEPVTIPNLVATVLHSLLDVGQVRLIRGMPADVLRAATDADPIAGMVS